MEELFAHKELNSKKFSRATLAGAYDEASGKLSLGISMCSKKDQYNRKIGNGIAIKRALKNPFITINVGINKQRKDVAAFMFSFDNFEDYIKIQSLK